MVTPVSESDSIYIDPGVIEAKMRELKEYIEKRDEQEKSLLFYRDVLLAILWFGLDVIVTWLSMKFVNEAALKALITVGSIISFFATSFLVYLWVSNKRQKPSNGTDIVNQMVSAVVEKDNKASLKAVSVPNEGVSPPPPSID
jgi:glucan phosphoethanolaminetransferase (alkaline phosphatase superfamily)